MKSKAIVKYFVWIGSILVLCIGLASCSGSHPNNGQTGDKREQNQSSEETIKEKDDFDYSILRNDGKFYIVFDNISLYDNNGQNQLAFVDFTSMKEFKDAVTKGTLTEGQKEIIATTFRKNENGILSCDFNNLYVPALPSGGSVERVVWSGGESYSFELKLQRNVLGFLHYYTPSEYKDIYMSEYETFFDRDTITVSKTERLDGNKIATYYSTNAGEFMQIRYSLFGEGKTFIVDKSYCLYYGLNIGDAGIPVSASVPCDVTLYCVEGGRNYVIELYGFVEDSADSWLLEFGLSQYREDNAADK